MQQQGGNRNENNNTHWQSSSSPRGIPTGIIFGHIDVSSSYSYCTSTLGTHILFACTNPLDGILGSHTNVICQRCHVSGHSTDSCPSHYQPHQQSVLPIYATLNFVNASEQISYPNSVVASCMTLDNGNLLTISTYSRDQSC